MVMVLQGTPWGLGSFEFRLTVLSFALMYLDHVSVIHGHKDIILWMKRNNRWTRVILEFWFKNFSGRLRPVCSSELLSRTKIFKKVRWLWDDKIHATFSLTTSGPKSNCTIPLLWKSLRVPCCGLFTKLLFASYGVQCHHGSRHGKACRDDWGRHEPQRCRC